MHKQNTAENFFLYRIMSISAWIACLLLLIILVMGDDILQDLTTRYPDWSFPAFFIPWFLLVISSVQKLPKSEVKMGLQLWVLKTTLPIFVFIAPFFIFSKSAIICIDDCIKRDGSLLEGGLFAVYIAIMVLFALHFLPMFNRKNKID